MRCEPETFQPRPGYRQHGDTLLTLRGAADAGSSSLRHVRQPSGAGRSTRRRRGVCELLDTDRCVVAALRGMRHRNSRSRIASRRENFHLGRGSQAADPSRATRRSTRRRGPADVGRRPVAGATPPLTLRLCSSGDFSVTRRCRIRCVTHDAGRRRILRGGQVRTAARRVRLLRADGRVHRDHGSSVARCRRGRWPCDRRDRARRLRLAV